MFNMQFIIIGNSFAIGLSTNKLICSTYVEVQIATSCTLIILDARC